MMGSERRAEVYGIICGMEQPKRTSFTYELTNDQQEILLEGVCAALERNLEAARSRTGEVDRLYVSLGALTGLMIALILI